MHPPDDEPVRIPITDVFDLHTVPLIRQHAQTVYQQVVVLKQMPFGNATQMTDDERAVVKRWYEAGASDR